MRRPATNATASSATTIPAGLNRSESTRWPCATATTARVIPQKGHGMPVTVRSGHASGG